MGSVSNWNAFYRELGKIGPKLLDGLNPGFYDWVSEQASNSDAFWSEAMCRTLEAWWDDDPKQAIQETLSLWLENVKQHLNQILGPHSLIPWENLGGTKKEKQELQRSIKQIQLKSDSELVKRLVAAAYQRL
jgi:hypothetical protein